MDQQRQLRYDTTYVDGVIEQLRELYLTRTSLPNHTNQPLTIAQFYRMYHCVLAEGYGGTQPSALSIRQPANSAVKEPA